MQSEICKWGSLLSLAFVDKLKQQPPFIFRALAKFRRRCSSFLATLSCFSFFSLANGSSNASKLEKKNQILTINSSTVFSTVIIGLTFVITIYYYCYYKNKKVLCFLNSIFMKHEKYLAIKIKFFTFIF